MPVYAVFKMVKNPNKFITLKNPELSVDRVTMLKLSTSKQLTKL